MRRRLLIFLLLPGVVGWAQTVSGSWSGEISLVPSLGLTSTEFELAFTPTDQWTLSSRSEFFGADGWVWQEFSLSGTLEFMDIESFALFGPKAPVFLYSQSRMKARVAELDLELYSAYVGPDTMDYFSGGPSGGMVAVATAPLNSVSLRAEIGIGARLTEPWAPFTITYTGAETHVKDLLVDPFPGGLQFTYLDLTLEGLSLCCDISLDLELYFTKTQGFEYLEVSAENLIQLCCDIAIDVTVTFTTDSKRLSIEPHWPGVTGCVKVYGDVQYAASLLSGLELYGFEIRCELQECYALELLTAFRPDLFYVVNDKLLVAPTHLPFDAEPLFKQDEFEYIKISACGPSCCGANWVMSIGAFFQKTTGNLFGLSRFLIEAKVPLMESLSLTSSLEVAIPGGPSLDVGWEFVF